MEIKTIMEYEELLRDIKRIVEFREKGDNTPLEIANGDFKKFFGYFENKFYSKFTKNDIINSEKILLFSRGKLRDFARIYLAKQIDYVLCKNYYLTYAPSKFVIDYLINRFRSIDIDKFCEVLNAKMFPIFSKEKFEKDVIKYASVNYPDLYGKYIEGKGVKPKSLFDFIEEEGIGEAV